MKLAYVLNTYPQRSHSFIRREVQALERRGHSVVRLAMRPAGAAMIDPLDSLEEERTEHLLAKGSRALIGAILHCAYRFPKATFSALRQAWGLWHAADKGLLHHLVYVAEACFVALRCRAQGVEHIHAHFGTNAATVAMLAHTISGLPYSFTVHGPEEFDSPLALGLRHKMGRAAFTVAISQFGRSQLFRWAKPEVWNRVHVVHCGIEPAAFADPPALRAGSLRLVCIGRFVEQKGHLILIDAIARLRRNVPDFHLTLVGDGEMRPLIEQAIEAHGLSQNVTITGWVDEARIRTELASAQALVAPSFAEGLPMVVMEAMAAARPVIATYVAGNPELVQPGESGWLVPAGDAAALCQALSEAAATPLAKLKKMGKAGRERALLRHDIETEVDRLAALFAASISAGSNP